MHRYSSPSRRTAIAVVGTLGVLAGLVAFAPAATRRSSPRGMAAPTVRFDDVRLSTGVRLHFAEQGDTAGHAVIMLHGYSDTWYSFSAILPLLPADVHAFALDQRGHGDSDRPASGYALPELAADVVAFMDARRITRATIVGHSLGSLVAQQVALLAPGRVTGLVLVGAGTQARRIGGIDELHGAVASLADPVPLEFTRGFQESTIHRPLPPSFVERVSEDSRRLPAHAWRAIMDGMLATPAATGLGTAGIPTLVLWGDHDSVFPRSEQDALLAMIPGATLSVYPETGHALHWERPDVFAKDLVHFVRTAARR